MRPTVLGILAAIGLVAAAVLHGRVGLDPFAHARAAPAGPLTRTPIEADTVKVSEPGLGVIAYRMPLPEIARAESVELRFRDRLDGARVEALADGPQIHLTLLRKRIGGDTVVVPLPLGTVDMLEIRVHRNLRPPPLVRDVAVVVPVRAAAAADPPPATSPRSTR